MEFGKPAVSPYFRPWIGSDYEEALHAVDTRSFTNGKLDRVHLMGESHYSDEELSPDWTTDAVKNLALTQNRYGRFWTSAIQTYTNLPTSDFDRAEAWQCVAYSNFIQKPLQAARQAVPDEHWKSGQDAFFAQLAHTRPTVLVVLGKRLFSNLPNIGMRIPWNLAPCPDWEPIEDAWLYGYETEQGRHLTVAVSVTHPSGRGFQWEKAARRVAGARIFYSNIVVAFSEGRLE